MRRTIVELKNIRKEFPGVVALDQVNMKIRSSTVHALVGENGAGKSTLMKILSGTYTGYGGTVFCEGKEIHMKSEKDAYAHGISIVAQELNYVPELTISENLFLGREQKKGKLFLNKKERKKQTKELLKIMNLDYEPDEKMGNLNVDVYKRQDQVWRMWQPHDPVQRKVRNILLYLRCQCKP